MRKAGLKRPSRRKQNPKDDFSTPNQTTNDAAPPASANSAGDRKKATSDEAALTAKNYRLAKELSDLRVRHRDETKNVTRLTMENMNLASRCREAISHVAMLKKELAMHQRRAAEALALQRQHAQRMASNVSDPGPALPHYTELLTISTHSLPPSTDVAVEMDRMDRILAAKSPPPPPPPKPVPPTPQLPKPIITEIEDNDNDEEYDDNEDDGTLGTNGEDYSDLHADSTEDEESPTSRQSNRTAEKNVDASEAMTQSSPSGIHTGNNGRRTIDDVLVDERPNDSLRREQFSPKPLFPHTASPKVSSKDNYDDEFPGDITAQHVAHEMHILPAVLDDNEQETESVPVSVAREEARKKLSSIDAFEASFDTAFPPSFSSPKDDSPTESNSAEIYNPFFPSPARTPKSNTDGPRVIRNDLDKERKWSTSIRERSPVPRDINVRKSGEIPSEIEPGVRSPPKVSPPKHQRPSMEDVNEEHEMRRPSNELFADSDHYGDLSNSPRATRKTTSGEHYHTPPHLAQRDPDSATKEPRRPEKAVSPSVRARYEKALQPRIFGGPSRQVGRLREKSGDGPESSSVASDSGGEEAPPPQETKHSPSMVLKRLQQRKFKERSASEASSTSPDSSFSTAQHQLGPVPVVISTGGDPRRPTRPARTFSEREVARAFHDRETGRSFHDRDTYSLPSDEEDANLRHERERSGRIASSQNGGSSLRRSASEHIVRRAITDADPDTFHSTFAARARSIGSVASNQLSPNSMNAEFRALDAMVSATYPARTNGPSQVESSPASTSSSVSSRYMALVKQRRGVKQPVSYAEPPLNSKLRRGDIYFPKPGEEGNDDDIPNVSPSGSTDDMSGARKLTTARVRQGAGPDEVLKDLAGPTSVRS